MKNSEEIGLVHSGRLIGLKDALRVIVRHKDLYRRGCASHKTCVALEAEIRELIELA